MSKKRERKMNSVDKAKKVVKTITLETTKEKVIEIAPPMSEESKKMIESVIDLVFNAGQMRGFADCVLITDQHMSIDK